MYLKLMFTQKWQLFSHLFTHKLFHEFLSSVENERRIVLNESDQTVVGPINFHSTGKKLLWKSVGTKNVLVIHILHNIFYVQQRNSYRLGTTCGWVIDDRIYIFEWASPFKSQKWKS